jgi:hypothetical protein
MEPIDKWTEGFKEYSASLDPATRTYIMNRDFASLYSSITVSGSEPEEKTPTFNEPRLNPIKP